jgi:hypothetical protein
MLLHCVWLLMFQKMGKGNNKHELLMCEMKSAALSGQQAFINPCAGRLASALLCVTCTAVCDNKFCEFAKLTLLDSFHMYIDNCQY